MKHVYTFHRLTTITKAAYSDKAEVKVVENLRERIEANDLDLAQMIAEPLPRNRKAEN